MIQQSGHARNNRVLSSIPHINMRYFRVYEMAQMVAAMRGFDY
jgi:hypothetical protein